MGPGMKINAELWLSRYFPRVVFKIPIDRWQKLSSKLRGLCAWSNICRKNREKQILANMSPYVRIRPSVLWALYQLQNLSISMIIFTGCISNYGTDSPWWFLIKYFGAKVCPWLYVEIRLLYHSQNSSISMTGFVSSDQIFGCWVGMSGLAVVIR